MCWAVMADGCWAFYEVSRGTEVFLLWQSWGLWGLWLRGTGNWEGAECVPRGVFLLMVTEKQLVPHLPPKTKHPQACVMCQQTPSCSEACIHCYTKIQLRERKAFNFTWCSAEQLRVGSPAPQRDLLSQPLPVVLSASWESLCTLILETDKFPLIWHQSVSVKIVSFFFHSLKLGICYRFCGS